MAAVAGAWVALDGPAAMRWVSEQPAGSERDDAVFEGLRSWAASDPAAAQSWIAQSPLTAQEKARAFAAFSAPPARIP
jgi:hypothetical protein